MSQARELTHVDYQNSCRRRGIRRKVTLQLKVNLRACFFRDQNTQILFDKLLLRVPEVGEFHFQRKRRKRKTRNEDEN
jgi:hypothetical protein